MSHSYHIQDIFTERYYNSIDVPCVLLPHQWLMRVRALMDVSRKQTQSQPVRRALQAYSVCYVAAEIEHLDKMGVLEFNIAPTPYHKMAVEMSRKKNASRH